MRSRVISILLGEIDRQTDVCNDIQKDFSNTMAGCQRTVVEVIKCLVETADENNEHDRVLELARHTLTVILTIGDKYRMSLPLLPVDYERECCSTCERPHKRHFDFNGSLNYY